MIGVRAYTGTSPVPRVGCHSVGGGEEEKEGADELTVTNDHQRRPRKLKNGEVTSVHAKNARRWRRRREKEITLPAFSGMLCAPFYILTCIYIFYCTTENVCLAW